MSGDSIGRQGLELKRNGRIYDAWIHPTPLGSQAYAPFVGQAIREHMRILLDDPASTRKGMARAVISSADAPEWAVSASCDEWQIENADDQRTGRRRRCRHPR